jgi:hypothetical protein
MLAYAAVVVVVVVLVVVGGGGVGILPANPLLSYEATAFVFVSPFKL